MGREGKVDTGEMRKGEVNAREKGSWKGGLRRKRKGKEVGLGEEK